MKKYIIIPFILGLLISASASNKYTDTYNHWATTYIDRMSDRNLIHGYPDKTFKPDNYILKSEAYAIINRSLNLNKMTSTNFHLSDSLWCKKDLEKAVAYGYITNTTFKDEYITRLEVTNIIGYLYNLKSEKQYHSYFTDIDDLNDTSKSYIGKLLKDNVLHGYNDFSFKSNSKITRAEFIKLISICLDKYDSSNIQSLEEKEINKTTIDNTDLTLKLKNLITKYENLDFKKYTKESLEVFNSILIHSKKLLVSNPTNEELEKTINNLETSFINLKENIKNKMYKLSINSIDESGNNVNSTYTLNDEPFTNGSLLPNGTYHLKVIAPGMITSSSYVTISDEDKIAVITLIPVKTENKLSIKLSENLSCEQGNIFNFGERVTIQIDIPDGKEVDKLYVNGKPQTVLSDEYSFQIKEDVRISVTFKEIEE